MKHEVYFAFNHEKFVERLEDIREKKLKLTQKDFCEKIGISTRQYQKWLVKGVDGSETPPPSMNKAIKICEICGISLDYLIGRTDYIGVDHKIIGEKLGLTPEAIKKLESLWEVENNNDPSPKVEMLSILIERPEFVYMLAAILDTNIEFNNLMSHAISEAEKNGHNTIQFREEARRCIMNDINKLSRAFTYAEYKTARYGILQNISNMIDEINVSHDGLITRQKQK